MDRIRIARELVKIARELTGGWYRRYYEDDSADLMLQEKPVEFEKMDTSLNSAVTKVLGATDGDLSQMLTVTVMALKKSGNASAASKVYTMFKTLLKQISRRMDDFSGEAEDFRRTDSTLNSAVTRLVAATGGSLSKMLTVVIMALRKAGHGSEANKIYSVFRAFLKKMEQRAPSLV